MNTFKYQLALAFLMVSGIIYGLKAQAPKALAVGSPAPAFAAVDQDGKVWKLADLLGKQIVLLYFYPKDQTPGCTIQACGLRDQMSELKQGRVTVLGVSFDSAESHQAFISKHNLNFPLLVDRDGKLADLYQTRKSPDAKMARRVSFLIGLDGAIKHITDTNNAAVHLTEMKNAIAKLKTN